MILPSQDLELKYICKDSFFPRTVAGILLPGLRTWIFSDAIGPENASPEPPAPAGTPTAHPQQPYRFLQGWAPYICFPGGEAEAWGGRVIF